jgi:hypothetical protein
VRLTPAEQVTGRRAEPASCSGATEHGHPVVQPFGHGALGGGAVLRPEPEDGAVAGRTLGQDLEQLASVDGLGLGAGRSFRLNNSARSAPRRRPRALVIPQKRLGSGHTRSPEADAHRLRHSAAKGP